MVNFTHIKCERDRICHYMVVETLPTNRSTRMLLPIQIEASNFPIESFEQKYFKLLHKGGVIGTSFMQDAFQLNKKEIQQKYPRDESYLEDPEVQIEYIQGRTKIKLTPEQRALYYNLRWIPSSFLQVIIMEKSEKFAKRIEYKHPSELDEIGLLSQVFKFTGDTYSENLLRRYCQMFKSSETYEIDL